MATALPLTNEISQQSSKDAKINLLTTSFGDGYEQRVPYGINYKKDVWKIVWENITTSQKDTIENAFAASNWGANTISWTPIGESSVKYFKYDMHNVTYLSGELCIVECQLTQVFDLI